MSDSEYRITINGQRYMKLQCLDDGLELFSVCTLAFTQKELGVLVARSLKTLFHADTDDRFAQLITAQERGVQRLTEVLHEVAEQADQESRAEITEALFRFEDAVKANATVNLLDVSSGEKGNIHKEYRVASTHLKEVLGID